MAPMLGVGGARSEWLRPLAAAGGEPFARAGHLVRRDVRLGDALRGRPPGLTTRQWGCANRAHLSFIAYDAGTAVPAFAVQVRAAAPEAGRDDRMTDAVCAAAGLPLLRVESLALAQPGPARRLVEYVLDARAFAGTAGADGPGDGPGYREIVGRLPGGRTGYVNDLSAVARAAAVEAYAARQIADPTIRGLHVRWVDGTAEGWAWLDVRAGGCLFERAQVWQVGVESGVDPARLAEDLAAASIGEHLKTLETLPPPLRDRADLARDLAALRERSAQMSGGFRHAHLSPL
jgi:hypothetical protein